jgi:GTP-binding protein
MTTLPPPSQPEIAFIGRSNCGKSSLINMLTNRKALAYTSKTPGKTSEFNYFDAKSTVGVDKEPYGFYLVDVPGVGFARKDVKMRSGWSTLLTQFTTQRTTLTTLFHLIDSRHGMMDADLECFALIETLPPTCQYVVVLTKADKRGGARKVDMIQDIRKELCRREINNPVRAGIATPIVLTSSETKQGAPELWSIMLDSMADERPIGFIA